MGVGINNHGLFITQVRGDDKPIWSIPSVWFVQLI